MRRKDSAVTSSRTLIPISSIKFIDDIPRLRDVEERLKKFLRQRRLAALEATEEDDPEPSGRISYHYEEIDESDGAKIKRRSMRYLERVHSSTGIYHLSEQNAAKLTPLRGGLPVSRITNEHEADVIAAALHSEMPWMARATEEVWLGMRRSVRDDLPGVRFKPLVLNGPPGIGKSYWARRRAHHLAVPTTMIEATGEPATFSLVGTQKGWGSAAPGKLILTVLRERSAGPLVIIDEVEKVGSIHSTQGARHTLTDALLPLLERMTAATWECPFFQIRLDMSWVNWVMTVNNRQGLPEPLQSRCTVLDLPALSTPELVAFARRQGEHRNLPETAISSLEDILCRRASRAHNYSLRDVNNMLDRAEMLVSRPTLH
jgi:hypothetical protein